MRRLARRLVVRLFAFLIRHDACPCRLADRFGGWAIESTRRVCLAIYNASRRLCAWADSLVETEDAVCRPDCLACSQARGLVIAPDELPHEPAA